MFQSIFLALLELLILGEFFCNSRCRSMPLIPMFCRAVCRVASDIQQVHISPVSSVRLHSNAQLVCVFRGNDLELQHVTWTKEFVGGGSQFVYSYDACAREDRGFGALRDRAVLDIAKPSDEGAVNDTSNQIAQTGSATLTILVSKN